MARVHFPSLVAAGENPNAKCIAQTANGTLHDGVGGDGDYDLVNRKEADGPRWGALGKQMLSPWGNLKPSRYGK